MMYRIFKHGTWLTELGAWWQTWIDSDKRALGFYDKTEADALAEKLDAFVIAVPVLN